MIISSIEYATGRKRIEKAYTEIRAVTDEPIDVWPAIIDRLGFKMHFDNEKWMNIPSEGPLVIVANHPFGVVDGLMLGYLLSLIRKKFMVITNSVLCHEALFKPFLLPVDFSESKEALQTNINTRNTTLKRLLGGEALGIFPAGAVANSPKPFSKFVEDWEWKLFVAKAIQQAKATVVPIYFEGMNSRWFQIASHLSPILRASFLLNEVRNKLNKEFYIHIGEPMQYEKDLATIRNRKELLDYLRYETEKLSPF